MFIGASFGRRRCAAALTLAVVSVALGAGLRPDATLPVPPTTISPTRVLAASAPPATIAPTPAVPVALPPEPEVAPAPIAVVPVSPPAPPTPHTIEERGKAALELVRYPYEGTGFTVRFEPGREGILGLTSEATKTISIYVRPSHSPEDLARTIAHEIGHAIDLAWMNDDLRTKYLAARGVPSMAWLPTCARCSDYASPAGDFAETFAALLLPADSTFRSTLAPRPSAADLPGIKAFFLPRRVPSN